MKAKKTDHTTPELSAFQMRVKEFQDRNSLKADAIVGPITWGIVESIETALSTSTRRLNEALDDLANCRSRRVPVDTNPGLGGFLFASGVGFVVGLIVGIAF